MPPTNDPGKASCHAALVARADLQSFKGKLHHQAGCYAAYRSERIPCVVSNESIDFPNLRIVESTVRFSKRHKRSIFPERKGVIGEQTGALPVSFLGVDQNLNDRVGSNIP